MKGALEKVLVSPRAPARDRLHFLRKMARLPSSGLGSRVSGSHRLPDNGDPVL